MERSLALFTLEGRTAIVTGAASGLGRTIAVGLGQAGAYVVAADLPGSTTEDTVEEVGSDRAVAVRVDVTKREEIEAMTDAAVRRTGRVDVLVNSAGIGGRGAAEAYPAELWDRVLAVNLTGTFNGAARRPAHARRRFRFDRQRRLDRRACRLLGQRRLPGLEGALSSSHGPWRSNGPIVVYV